MWPLLRRTMLLSHEMFRIESRWMRARCAVGLALQVSPPRRDRLCTEADGLAGRIAAEPVSWGQGIAAALRGAVASVRGDDGGAIDWLRRAEPLLARASLDMLVATVKRARGRLMGGQEGQRLEADAQQWFADQGVCEPARFGAMVVPGRWDRL